MVGDLEACITSTLVTPKLRPCEFPCLYRHTGLWSVFNRASVTSWGIALLMMYSNM